MAKPVSSWWLSPPVIVRYAVAVALVGGTIAIEKLMEEQLVGAPALLFLCAVMLSAWFGGFRPGLFAAALALLAFDYYFVSPDHALVVAPEEVPRVVIFGLSVC